MSLTIDTLNKIMPKARSQAGIFLPALNAAMAEFDIDTPARQASFLAQVGVESGQFSALVENLNYSAAGLLATFKTRFTATQAAEYARHPERIANRAYANRMGNGAESSGDGWRYRGRGLIQITGRANYATAGAALGLDLIEQPELLEQPVNACRSAAWWWDAHDLNALADVGDQVRVTKRVNGGTNGLADRLALFSIAQKELA